MTALIVVNLIAAALLALGLHHVHKGD